MLFMALIMVFMLQGTKYGIKKVLGLKEQPKIMMSLALF